MARRAARRLARPLLPARARRRSRPRGRSRAFALAAAARLADALRGARGRAAGAVDRAHGARVPARRAVPRALALAAAPPRRGSTSTRRSQASRASRSRSPSWRCSSCASRARSRSRRPRRSPRSGFPVPPQKGASQWTATPPDRLEPGRRARPHDRGAARRRLAAALRASELADATGDDPERVADALELLGERYREGRSGIVLEHVAGGCAFRASREAAEACARLFERPVERGLSQAALETLAIVAYLGPCTRPEITRIRGVNADGVGRRARRARPDRRGRPRRASSAPSATRRRRSSSASSGSSRSPSCRGSTTSAPTPTQIRERLEAVAEKRPA